MRRVWIEILQAVGLLDSSHPPCGGCGLKSRNVESQHELTPVTLHAEGVD